MQKEAVELLMALSLVTPELSYLGTKPAITVKHISPYLFHRGMGATLKWGISFYYIRVGTLSTLVVNQG